MICSTRAKAGATFETCVARSMETVFKMLFYLKVTVFSCTPLMRKKLHFCN